MLGIHISLYTSLAEVLAFYLDHLLLTILLDLFYLWFFDSCKLVLFFKEISRISFFDSIAGEIMPCTRIFSQSFSSFSPHCCLAFFSYYFYIATFFALAFSAIYVTNFIQLIFLQPVDRFLQTKWCWKAPNEGYLHICRIYKSNNKWLRYQTISSCKSFVC